jgi:hypothetical protein
VIVLNTNAAFRLHAWCLCGNSRTRSGDDIEVLRAWRRQMKKYGCCPRCGSAWMSFEIREGK